MLNTKFNVSLLSVSLAFFSCQVFASSPVWKVSKGEGNSVYIGGTVHILAPSDYPLPKAFERAYKESDQLLFEVDISSASKPEFQQKLFQSMQYPQGVTLQSHLKPDVLQALEEYCQARNIPLAQLSGFRPGMLMLTLMTVELQRLGLMGTGVDQYFNLKAIKDGKSLGFLETIDQQITFLVDMGEGIESAFIEYTLKDLDQLGAVMSDLKGAWRVGDNGRLEELGLLPMQQFTPEVHQSIISQRNHNWIPSIEKLFLNDETELVLVGALHLVGDEGLLKILESKGYILEQLK